MPALPYSYVLKPLLILLIVPYLTYRLLARYLTQRGQTQRTNYDSNNGSAKAKQSNTSATSSTTVAFFHPFCNSGGGGERVLWQYVRALQEAEQQRKKSAAAVSDSSAVRILIYTGDTESPEEILSKAANRFNLPLLVTSTPQPTFIRLKLRKLVTAELYPRFTMFGQSFGSIVLAAEALWKATPDIFVDTTGFAFTYPLASKLFGARVHSYTHYPTISTDMLQLVFERRESYNNSAENSGSLLRARVKWLYYKIFASLYSIAGRHAELIFTNSTWTQNHINQLWQANDRTHIVFPPCDTKNLREISLGTITKLGSSTSSSSKSQPQREDLIISIGQFRPEKDHSLQLHAFALFLKKLSELAQSCPGRRDSTIDLAQRIKLVLIGGARDDGDRDRVEKLRQLAAQLDITSQVDFQINVPFEELKSWLSRATAGLHTMWNEHFGIGVVEFMAAGVITVAHNSGGPRSDILLPTSTGQSVGYLASSAEEYADALFQIFASEKRGGEDMMRMREAARERANAFSDEVFIEQLANQFVTWIG